MQVSDQIDKVWITNAESLNNSTIKHNDAINSFASKSHPETRTQRITDDNISPLKSERQNLIGPDDPEETEQEVEQRKPLKLVPPIFLQKIATKFFDPIVPQPTLQQPTSTKLETDPLQGQSFLNQVRTGNILQKRFCTPFNYCQPVQTLQNPQILSPYEFITVSQVVINVHPYPNMPKPQADYQNFKCNDGHDLIYTEVQDAVCSKCRQSVQKVWKCTCDVQLCPTCFSTKFTISKLCKDSEQHKQYQPYQIVQNGDGFEVQQGESDEDLETFAMVGFWQRQQTGGIECVKQFRIKDAVYFPINLGHKDHWEKVVLHISENNELYYFSSYDNSIKIVDTIIDQNVQDLPVSLTYQLSEEMQINVQCNYSINQNTALNFQVLPRLTTDTLIIQQLGPNTRFSVKTPAKPNKFKQLIKSDQTYEDTSLIFYNLKSQNIKFVESTVCVLSIDSEAVWVLQLQSIQKIALRTLEVEQTYKITQRKGLDYIAKIVTATGVSGYLHGRCTVMSSFLKSFIVFKLTEKLTAEVVTIQECQENICLWKNSMLMITGLQKQQEQYQFKVFDLNSATITKTDKMVVKIPIDLINKDTLCRNILIPVALHQLADNKYEIDFFVFYAEFLSSLPKINFISTKSQFTQTLLRLKYLVDYPLFFQNTYHPQENQVIIGYLGQNVPKKRIDLGKYSLVSFVETSFSRLNCNEIQCDIFLIVRYQHQYYLMKYTTSPWPLPIGHPEYSNSLIDKVFIYPESIEIQSESIVQAVLLEGRIRSFSLYFLFVQQHKGLQIFRLEGCRKKVAKELNFDIVQDIAEIKLVCGQNQSCFAVSAQNQILKFSVQSQIQIGLVVRPIYEQKAKILYLQINQDNQKRLLVYDALGTVKSIDNSSDYNVQIIKQLEAWQKDEINYIEKCPYQTIIIESRSIQYYGKDRLLMILNLNSSLIAPFGLQQKDSTLIFVASLPNIRKQIYAIMGGSCCYFYVQQNVSTRYVDIVSTKTESFCKGNYLIGNELFVKMAQHVLVFNQSDFIFQRVELCQQLKMLQCVVGSCQYVCKNYGTLLKYNAQGNSEVIRNDFDTVIQNAQTLLNSKLLQDFNLECTTNQPIPAIDGSGNLSLQFFVKNPLNELQYMFTPLITEVQGHRNCFKRNKIESDIRTQARILLIYLQCDTEQVTFSNLQTNTQAVLILGDQLQPGTYEDNFIYTNDYLVWNSKNIINFVRQDDIIKSNQQFMNFPLDYRLSQPQCGSVYINQLVIDSKFADKAPENIRLNLLTKVNVKIVCRDKPRRNLIQMRLQNLNLIWDLDENEEVDFLYSPQQFDSDYFVHTGYKHFQDESPIRCNFQQSLFAIDNQIHQQLKLFQLFSFIDIIIMVTIESLVEQGYLVKDIDPECLASNIHGRTFFSLFYQNHDLIQLAYNQVIQADYKSLYIQEDINQEVNHIFIRRIYQILKLPCILGRQGSDVSSYYRSINQADCNIDMLQTIAEYTIDKDEVLLALIIKYFALSNEFKIHNIQSTFKQFVSLFRPMQLKDARDQVLKYGLIQTDSCRRINALLSGDQEILFFGGDTTQYSEQYIKQRLEETAGQDSNLTMSSFSVHILELEWLMNNFTQFYFQIVHFEDEQLFDSKIFKFILSELDFTKQALLRHFLPEIVKLLLLQYYYSFILTSVQPSTGYLQGDLWPIIVRILILITDIYRIPTYFLYIINLYRIGIPLLGALIWIIFPISMAVFQEWIIFYHASGYTQVSHLQLIQMSSVCTLINFYDLFFVLQLFESTAMYVHLIKKTLFDFKYFFLMFFVVVCAFGNSIMIINRYDQSGSESDYTPLFENAFGSDLVDSFINQFMVCVGTFTYDKYTDNPSKTLLWIYFIMATFLTQIVFFNMLIAVMGTSYEQVMENKERSNLISRTMILSAFVFVCNIDSSRLSDHRYLYIAFRKAAQVEDVYIRKINKISENQKAIVDEIRSIQTSISDQIKEFKSQVKDQQDSTKNVVNSLSDKLAQFNNTRQKDIELVQEQYNQTHARYSDIQKSVDNKFSVILSRLNK